MVRVAEWLGVAARELSSTLFPHYCLVCGERLSADRLMICPACLDLLPRYPGSEALYEAEKRLEGHAPFTEYRSDLGFTHHNPVRDLIHTIKYEDHPELGERLSRLYAPEHLRAGHFADIGVAVPVPLTPSRLRRRGYNQSTYIARGLTDILGIPLDETLLARRDSHGTQTHRGRESRWESMKKAFYAPHPDLVSRRRVLIIDDVLTTGSTLTACALALMAAGAESVSYYTLACGKMA
ncbi:phosphoribosyltransferase family protein [uncultured Porphyromonas sp.]|uniref:ComF family protein n=1 Tax=uncultured Porphyromonas sp. TaxID=159274 RepID=UPI0026323DCE|nr:phosphoribosyltransferase family protein [uncultured Porphyromonas sp.]